MDKLLTIIVPVYKAEKFLADCVGSLRNQTYQNLEIILVNDGSPDGSGALCDAFAQKDSRIRVIHKENGGAASARNLALNVASGEYITFADSDDFLEPTAYETMLKKMEQYGVKLVCAGRYDVDNGVTTRGLCPETEEVISGEDLVRRIFLWKGADSSPCDKIFHRSLFETIRFPEGTTCEDVAILYKIALNAGAAAMLPVPVYYYRHHSESITCTAGLNPKSFHFSNITGLLYGDIRENYPNLIPEARYLRVRSLMHILLNLEVGTEEDRNRFHQEYADRKQQLRKHLAFLLGCPYFSARQKVTALLLSFNIYRPLRGLIHR